MRLTRRGLLFGAGAVGLALLPGCGAFEAEERFARDGEPALATLADGVRLRAHPARIRLDGATGEPVVRAATAQPRIELESTSARRVALTVENLPAATRFSPQPASATRLGPTAFRVELELQPGVTRLETVSEPAGPLRFAVVSDLHTNLEALAAIAADLRERAPELVLCMGDLADRGGAAEIDGVFAGLAALEAPFYSTLGNHELFGDAAARFDERFGPASLSFLYRGARFLLVDSASASVAPAAWAWIGSELAASPGPAFAFTHVPPLDVSGLRNHSFRIRDEALRFVELLAAHRAAGLFVGHVHDQAEYELAGVPVHLTGGGGKVKQWAAGVGLHYLEVELRPGEPPVVSRRDLEL